MRSQKKTRRKFDPRVTRVQLKPEQAVLGCCRCLGSFQSVNVNGCVNYFINDCLTYQSWSSCPS